MNFLLKFIFLLLFNESVFGFNCIACPSDAAFAKRFMRRETAPHYNLFKNFQIHDATARVCKHFAFSQNQFTMCKFHVIFDSILEARHYRAVYVMPFLGFSLLIHMYSYVFNRFDLVWFGSSRQRAIECKCFKFDVFPLRNFIQH